MLKARMKIFLGLALIVLAFYAGFVGVLFVTQRSHQYFPDKSRILPADSAAPDMTAYQVQTDDGLSNESWIKLPHDPTAKVIVFFHGNAGSHGGRAFKARRYL